MTPCLEAPCSPGIFYRSDFLIIPEDHREELPQVLHEMDGQREVRGLLVDEVVEEGNDCNCEANRDNDNHGQHHVAYTHLNRWQICVQGGVYRKEGLGAWWT